MRRLRKTNKNSKKNSAEVFQKKRKKKGDFDYQDIDRVEEMIKLFKGGRLIDIGCFDFPLVKEVKNKFPVSEVWGLDYCKEVIDYYKERYPEINYIQADIRKKLPFNKEYFDYVIAGELLEHLEKPNKAIKEMFRILKQGGILVVSVPDNERKGNVYDKEQHILGFSLKDIEDMFPNYKEVYAKDNKILVSTKK